MRLTLLLLLLFIWIHNQIFSFGSQILTRPTTAKTEVSDLQDGHPNHRLWQKMIDTERASSDDWYVKNLDLFYNLFFISYRYLSILSFCMCSVIKLIYRKRNDEWQVYKKNRMMSVLLIVLLS
jgi:ABC-type transport system involved in multi-copper enzyme maturation permease subunit